MWLLRWLFDDSRITRWTDVPVVTVLYYKWNWMKELPDWAMVRLEWEVMHDTNDPPDQFFLSWPDYQRWLKQEELKYVPPKK